MPPVLNIEHLCLTLNISVHLDF